MDHTILYQASSSRVGGRTVSSGVDGSRSTRGLASAAGLRVRRRGVRLVSLGLGSRGHPSHGTPAGTIAGGWRALLSASEVLTR